MAKIAVVGSFNMDLVVDAPRLPGPGETVLGGAFHHGVGGKGSNQAIASARLGGEVSFVGAVGRDGFGDEAIRVLEAERVGIDAVARSERPTGTALIVVDGAGENQIAVAPGANDDVTPDWVASASSVIGDADVLLVQLEVPIQSVEAAARVAHEAGTLVVLNPAPHRPLSDDIWSLVDHVTPNQHEVAAYVPSGDLAERALALADRGPSSVVVTRGGDGVLIATDGRTTALAGRRVDAVDSTGAGDAFNAGLAVALAEGADLVEAVWFAMGVGAFAVTRHGVLDGLPRRSDVVDWPRDTTEASAQ